MTKSCIIIGGGVGGLFTGALLAKNGVEVTVLEKNAIVGGGLQCFVRNGKTFETGMHVAGGFVEGGSIDKICRYLGIRHRLLLQHIPADCVDEIYIHATGETYRIRSGKDGFIDSISRYFPDEREGISRYVDAIFAITDRVPLFSLRGDGAAEHRYNDNFLLPADRFIDQFVADTKLKSVLAYLNPLYGGVKGHTPAYIHALLNVLYIKGTTRFVGGAQQLADLLKETIVANGGRVVDHCTVNYIDVANRKVNYVADSDGNRHTADCYVAAIHPAQMAKFVTPGTFRKSFINRLDSIPCSCSAFSVYIDLKPGTMRYIPHTCYYVENYERIWQQEDDSNGNWPNGFMYMTPPDQSQGEYASRLLIHCLMKYDQVKRWEATFTGQRGEAYERWKEAVAANLIDKLSELFPCIHDWLQNVYTSSPLTIRDYYATKQGAMFGYRKDCDNMIISRLPIYTKVKNLFLTGQNVILHGICGVPLTAILTAETILGRNTVVNAINAAYANETT